MTDARYLSQNELVVKAFVHLFRFICLMQIKSVLFCTLILICFRNTFVCKFNSAFKQI